MKLDSSHLAATSFKKEIIPLSLSLLHSMSDMPLYRAAEKLGVSTSYLKSACRRLGIARWPRAGRSTGAVSTVRTLPQVNINYSRRLLRKYAESSDVSQATGQQQNLPDLMSGDFGVVRPFDGYKYETQAYNDECRQANKSPHRPPYQTNSTLTDCHRYQQFPAVEEVPLSPALSSSSSQHHSCADASPGPSWSLYDEPDWLIGGDGSGLPAGPAAAAACAGHNGDADLRASLDAILFGAAAAADDDADVDAAEPHGPPYSGPPVIDGVAYGGGWGAR